MLPLSDPCIPSVNSSRASFNMKSSMILTFESSGIIIVIGIKSIAEYFINCAMQPGAKPADKYFINK